MAKGLPPSPTLHSSFSPATRNYNSTRLENILLSDTACTYFTPLSAIHAILVPLALAT